MNEFITKAQINVTILYNALSDAHRESCRNVFPQGPSRRDNALRLVLGQILLEVRGLQSKLLELGGE